MHRIIQDLMERGPVVLDGAWGTELQARGLSVGDFPDVWNLEHPERVLEVARSYVEAGSRVILTNTFGANRCRLVGHSLENQVGEINRAGVRISREAASGQAKVFASIGPSGRMLVAGEVSREELRTAFEEQARALADAGADALVVETMSDVDEAVEAVAAAKVTHLPVVACMVFDAGKGKDRTMTGVTPEQAVERLVNAGADIVGANCGQGVAGFIPICRRMRAVTDRPLWMKANAGLPELLDGRVIYRTSAQEFADLVPALRLAGADFLGGCCGTNPDYIRELAAKLAV